MTKQNRDVTGLTVKPKSGWIYVRKNKQSREDAGWWSSKKRLEVVTTYLTTGNLSLTGRLCNIPDSTLRKWKQSEWWQQLTDKYYEEDNISLDGKLSKTLEKTLNVINDRIADGDYQYNPKTGKLVRVPVKLRDAHRVASDLIDKRMVLRKQKKTETASVENTNDKLAKLAEAFAAFATGKHQEEKVVAEVIEGDFEHLPDNYQEAMRGKNNAVHDQETTLESRTEESTR